jgi:hypothetical protein
MLDGGKLLNGRPGPAKQTKARPAAPSKVDQRGSPKMTTSTTTGQSALTATTVHRSHKPRRPKCTRATPGKVAAKVATRAPAEASSRYAPRQGKGTAAPDVVGYGAHLLPGAAAASGSDSGMEVISWMPVDTKLALKGGGQWLRCDDGSSVFFPAETTTGDHGCSSSSSSSGSDDDEYDDYTADDDEDEDDISFDSAPLVAPEPVLSASHHHSDVGMTMLYPSSDGGYSM